MTPAKALKCYSKSLTQYEQSEILDYPQIYYLGIGASKVKGSSQSEHNFGYDDHKGNYKIIVKDHIGYRYEVM
jgi:dual specificity tyrosine-phosphorylation-regulated kinase 2/3/4